MKRALVTGASGHIGRHLLRALTDLDVQTYAVTRGAAVTTSSQGRWLVGDLVDPDFVRACLRQAAPDVVFHLGGLVSGSRDVTMVAPTLAGILEPTVNVLIASEEQNTRVVIAGSVEDPGPGARRVPTSPYGVAKEASRRYGEMFHEVYGTRVANARIFMVYGPGEQPRSRLVPYIVESLLQGRPPLLSSGSRLVDWVHVDDVVRGLLALASCEQAWGRTLDLGSGEMRRTVDVGEEVRALLDAPLELAWGAVPDRRGETEDRADVETTRQVCGWEPRISFDDGLTQTVQWLAQDWRLRNPSPSTSGA
jgi:nucleoside-diphosphate-sugar epimerase